MIEARPFGEVLAKIEAGAPTFPVRDKLGSPVAWADGIGMLSSPEARDSYGMRAAEVSRTVVYGYTGHTEDPGGLLWGRARYYEPRSATWLARDVYAFEPTYLYVWGQPDTLIDPDGKMAVEDGTARARRASSIVRKGRGPRGLDRIDGPHVPGGQWHAHGGRGTGKGAVNQDGNIKEGAVDWITKEIREFLIEHGWKLR